MAQAGRVKPEPRGQAGRVKIQRKRVRAFVVPAEGKEGAGAMPSLGCQGMERPSRRAL
jgi:hypothetical protein